MEAGDFPHVRSGIGIRLTVQQSGASVDMQGGNNEQ